MHIGSSFLELRVSGVGVGWGRGSRVWSSEFQSLPVSKLPPSNKGNVPVIETAETVNPTP